MERRGDSILKEKRFEYRAYVQLFYYPNHMKAIKEDNKRREGSVTHHPFQDKPSSAERQHTLSQVSTFKIIILPTRLRTPC